MSDDEIGALREALGVSPTNAPLRRLLARALARRGRWTEAEAELRELLRGIPDDRELVVELARAFEAQSKHSELAALLETRAARGAANATELVLLARAHLLLGERDRARRVYLEAVELEPNAADAALAQALDALPSRPPTRVPVVREGRVDDDGRADDAVEVERPRLTFADVGGMESLKEEIRLKIVHPLLHPEVYAAYGRPAGGGVLLYGPPGCGKTHVARATAGEVKSGFISVGISDVLDRWLGESERRLHETFDRARRHAPCVLFFDEVDALGASRGDMRFSAARHLVNQFLVEMDGATHSNDGVLVLAATNAPWHVDSAFRRPGRFDQVVFVPPPDERGRVEILEALLRGKPQLDLDLAEVAKRTREFSGADLKGLVDAAIEVKLREAIRTGRPAPILTEDLERAVSRTRPSTREWFATARNYALHANQGGVYDDVLRYLGLS